jgi:hypothetical protein
MFPLPSFLPCGRRAHHPCCSLVCIRLPSFISLLVHTICLPLFLISSLFVGHTSDHWHTASPSCGSSRHRRCTSDQFILPVADQRLCLNWQGSSSSELFGRSPHQSHSITAASEPPSVCFSAASFFLSGGAN